MTTLDCVTTDEARTCRATVGRKLSVLDAPCRWRKIFDFLKVEQEVSFSFPAVAGQRLANGAEGVAAVTNRAAEDEGLLCRPTK